MVADVLVGAYPALVCGIQLLGHICQLLQQGYFLLFVAVLDLFDLLTVGQEPLAGLVHVVVVGHHLLDLNEGG